MIRSVEVTNHLGDSLLLELLNPSASGFAVAGITGLGPPKADLNMTNMASYDGSVLNSARVDSRNIVITLVYYGNKIENLRHTTYKYFPVKKLITLTITTDTRVAKISGCVESNEVGIFSKTEGSQISIICPNPWFVAEGHANDSLSFSSSEPLLEFPIEDGNLFYDPKIEFGRLNTVSTGTIIYSGDLEVGVNIRLRVLSPPGNVAVVNSTTQERIDISDAVVNRVSGGNLTTGDEILISTVRGKKFARLLRGGRYINILSAVAKTSSWFVLSSGENVFAYTTDNGSGTLAVTINNQILYEGL